jgi:RNA polymerase sigma-70 factor (ECF subfamily)
MEPSTTNHELSGRGFGLWLERLQRELLGVAFRLAKNGPDAADLMQATCLRALEKRHLFVQGSVTDLRNWLLKIMRNLHLDGLRRRASEVLVDQFEDMPAPEPAPMPSWKMLDERALWSAIRQLAPGLREVYRLVAIERLPYVTISRRLRISITTVATRIHRARALLRQNLTATVAVPPPPVAPRVRTGGPRRAKAARIVKLDVSARRTREPGRPSGAPGARRRAVAIPREAWPEM